MPTGKPVRFFKVENLPNQFEPDSFYYIEMENGLHADSIITNSQGSARSIGVSLIDSRVMSALTTLSVAQAHVVPNIAAMGEYLLMADTNKLVLVMDASADPEVGAAVAALYVYEHNGDEPGHGQVHLVPGFSGVNVTLAWSNIAGRPTSTPTQIDAAVSASHNHANAAVLNALGENVSGNLTYKGNEIVGGGGLQWDQTDW
jgi:hypothetical protein